MYEAGRWERIFAIALVPVLLAVFIRRVVPEPPGWSQAASVRTTTEGSSQWKTVFANPQRRNIFILWTLTSCFLQFGYYGVNNWLPTYYRQ